jgi:hypothetical protein
MSSLKKAELGLLGLMTLAVCSLWLITNQLDEKYQGMALTFSGFIAGAAVTFWFGLLLEIARRPDLRITPIDAFANPISGSPQGPRIMDTIRVNIENRPLPRYYQWINREPVRQGYGRIQFYRCTSNGYEALHRPMPARWVTVYQPGPLFGYRWGYQGQPGRMTVCLTEGMLLYDVTRFDTLDQEPLQRMDIYPGDKKPLDVVCRYQDSGECFGYSNQYYLPDQLGEYKNTWPLPEEKYLVEIKMFSSAKPLTEYFILENSQTTFRLHQPLTLERPFAHDSYSDRH